KHGVKKLAKQLEALGYPVAALQGNMSQNARDRVMAEFRTGATPILLATNVAARGLDVDHVAQVINFELPETAGLLTHRVGRTGRMGREGEAITLLSPADEDAWRKLLRDLKRHPIRRPWRGRHETRLRSAADAPAAPALPARPVAAVAAAPIAVARPASAAFATTVRPATPRRPMLGARQFGPPASMTPAVTSDGPPPAGRRRHRGGRGRQSYAGA
ncbi:MAG: helicase-related protein, partial [Dehalococcoidia bacterium]